MNNKIILREIIICAIMIVHIFSVTGVVTAQNKVTSLSNDQSIPIIKPWKIIVQDKDYNGAWTVAGDLNNDGKAELVYARTSDEAQKPVMSALACTMEGKVLWKWGNPEGHQESLSFDVACQIYDWDNNGNNEVLLTTKQDDKTWLIELDGASGKEIRRFELPDGASDCISFSNISGPPNSYPTDILVKTRYSQVWAYNYEGKQLWTINEPGGYATAHQARPFDLNSDGIDEIMVGYVMVDAKGNPLWIANRDGTYSAGHLDCARLFSLGIPSTQGLSTPSRMVLTYCSGLRIAMIDEVGNLIWGISEHHFESIDVGKVRSDVFGKQIIVDLSEGYESGECPLWILDENGRKLTEIITASNRHHRLINWFGTDLKSILVAGERALYDGYGEKVAIFDTPIPEDADLDFNPRNYRRYIAFTGDMNGDSIPDIVLHTNPGSLIYIYKNEKGTKVPGKVMGSEVNYTLY